MDGYELENQRIRAVDLRVAEVPIQIFIFLVGPQAFTFVRSYVSPSGGLLKI